MSSSLSRRSFLTGVAAVALGSASATLLTACGGGSAGSADPAASTGVADSAAVASAAGTAGNKTLVAYFSGSGHTKRAADALADELGADIFVIEPADPYTEDDLNFNDDDSRVVKEHDDESARDYTLKANAPDNWAEYGTVLVGYPIWWGEAAWAMWGFADQNDFTGKTVIPFCTSYSSPIGDSGEQLAERAGTGDWQEGERFDQEVEEQDVREWARDLSI